jgi:hypothetical protein
MYDHRFIAQKYRKKFAGVGRSLTCISSPAQTAHEPHPSRSVVPYFSSSFHHNIKLEGLNFVILCPLLSMLTLHYLNDSRAQRILWLLVSVTEGRSKHDTINHWHVISRKNSKYLTKSRGTRAPHRGRRLRSLRL